MRSLLPLSAEEVREFRELVSARNVGVGVVDLLSGRVYLVVASQLSQGDHTSLLEERLGIDDFENAPHLRGFVVGLQDGRVQVGNNSGLNPYKNKMEPELFERLKSLLKSQLEVRQE